LWEIRKFKRYGSILCNQILRYIKHRYTVFEKYPIQGIKVLNFQDFYQVALLMNEKGHLTASGLKTIQNIKVGMNSGRSI
jgi:hypothetical protein